MTIQAGCLSHLRNSGFNVLFKKGRMTCSMSAVAISCTSSLREDWMFLQNPDSSFVQPMMLELRGYMYTRLRKMLVPG